MFLWFPNPRRYELSSSHIASSLSLPLPSNGKVGARLSLFASHWSIVTDDLWVLDTVATDLKINFLSEPSQSSTPREVLMTGEMQSVCNSEICNLLEKRAVEKITDGLAGFICSFFCVPKKREGLDRSLTLNPSIGLSNTNILKWMIWKRFVF